VGVVDLRGYEVPEEVKKDIDLDACWATWSVPFDREEDFHFVATAYYLSPAVRSHWEKKLGGQIIWQATTMDIIADFLDRLAAERNDGTKAKPGTRSPFAPAASAGSSRPPAAGGSANPVANSLPPASGSHIPFPVPGNKSATTL
jgi:hypothetical protein